MANLRRCVLPSVLAAVLLASCQSTGRTFQVTLETTFDDPLPVVLTDQTGLVAGITQAAVDSTIGFEPAVRAGPTTPGALILTWPGGACDADATMTFLKQEGRYLLGLATHEKAGGGCPSAGVPRGIRIVISA